MFKFHSFKDTNISQENTDMYMEQTIIHLIKTYKVEKNIIKNDIENSIKYIQQNKNSYKYHTYQCITISLDYGLKFLDKHY